MTLRHFARGFLKTAAALAILAAFLLPLYSAVRIIDDRNDRRAAAAAALAHAQTKAAINAARIESLAASNAATCAALNTDADRLNKVLDYTEIVAKMANPGPATDHFFAGLPRPIHAKCRRTP